MPATPATSGESIARRSRFWGFVAFAGSALAILVALVCAALLLVRYVLLPHVENYGPQIADRLSHLLGAPVTIERITTGWDGWNPTVDIGGLRVRATQGGGDER
ncbi:MAG: hypothetical protein DYH14_16945, partial [Betaproteobacteria bacterium PRO3]|nr:hypothetical protein [Betaproteobacteria bacterium PRO3]